MTVKPRTRCPELDVATLPEGRFRLAERKPESFTLLVFYRGLHCPVCKTYLKDLDSKVAEFAARGVDPVAVSMDTPERAAQARGEWGLERLVVAHGLAADTARAWGLYLSKAIREGEPALFSEPGLFLVEPDSTLYCASIQSMPSARPALADILKLVDFVREKRYPARGEA